MSGKDGLNEAEGEEEEVEEEEKKQNVRHVSKITIFFDIQLTSLIFLRKLTIVDTIKTTDMWA